MKTREGDLNHVIRLFEEHRLLRSLFILAKSRGLMTKIPPALRDVARGIYKDIVPDRWTEGFSRQVHLQIFRT
ncbi:MAG: hypothetical protein MUO58_03245 [Anaerolineales bacterium]|nr:hypothetical protein [Anaerolineales bacterium]